MNQTSTDHYNPLLYAVDADKMKDEDFLGMIENAVSGERRERIVMAIRFEQGLEDRDLLRVNDILNKLIRERDLSEDVYKLMKLEQKILEWETYRDTTEEFCKTLDLLGDQMLDTIPHLDTAVTKL